MNEKYKLKKVHKSSNSPCKLFFHSQKKCKSTKEYWDTFMDLTEKISVTKSCSFKNENVLVPLIETYFLNLGPKNANTLLIVLFNHYRISLCT